MFTKNIETEILQLLTHCFYVQLELKGSSSLIESVDDTGWKADFNVVPCMQFLIMDREIYRKYMFEPCDTIRKYVPILHRYLVSLEDMEQANWTIVYPPEGEN